MPLPFRSLVVVAAVSCAAASCSGSKPPGPQPFKYALNGPLVPAKMTMMAAWDVPKNPLTDSSLGQSRNADEIRWGYRLFTNTPAEAPRFVPGRVSCSNCHLNAGQRERALPLVAVSGVFPEFNNRAGRFFSLEDRIVDCFLRSENAPGAAARDGKPPENLDSPALPGATSKEVVALAAYLTWLSDGYPVGVKQPWRGQNAIPKAAQIPVAKLDRAKGEELYKENCVNCHGPDGQGVQIGDKRAAPLWGPDSWNDGAGAARVYTLAGMIRYMMPYLNPGSLTDEQAQEIAAFITSQPRPSFPFKAQDFLTTPLPRDAVYYPPRPSAK